MQVEILIDNLTDCLVERETGIIIETEYKERVTSIRPKEYKGWKFDWSITEKNGYKIYELFVKGDATVQGRISLKVDGGVVDVDIVESAPYNYGHDGKYVGVGGHLFAIACFISLKAGCDGFVAFTAKNKLIEHYKNTLGAKVLNGQRMYIDDVAAQILIEKYIRRC